MTKRNLFLYFLVVAALLAATSSPIKSLNPGQNQSEDLVLTVGKNVNMVSGTTLPGGDPWLQRQNEPSIAASTRNPLHLLAGANDYRTVDMPIEGEELPGVEDKIAAGDAWLGVFKSLDGGQTWTSTLLPGFPQDTSPEGLASPLKGYRAAADPVVRAGTNGLFYYSGIVFNRDSLQGAVFVARFIDNNNEESGDPIKYVDTIIVDQQNGVKFKDKPWIAVDVPKSSPPTITIDGQTIPCGNVYMAYSVFTGEGDTLASEIIFRRSTDCGTTWENPIVLSTGHTLNQGASVAVDPKGTEKVYVAWRRFEKDEQQNAIVIALSENSGKSFHQVVDVATIPSGETFDQPSSAGEPGNIPGTAFRTNSYPTLALDNKGHAYLAWSQRDGDPLGPPRIVIATSTDGIYWSLPTYVEIPEEPAHQIMPSMTFASGKLMLVWYDLRNDYAMYWGPWITDFAGFCDWRHTIDVRITQADPSMTPVFEPSKQVSRYIYHFIEDPEDPGSWIAYQGQFNPPNFPLFKGGTLPFMGDYIDITPSPMFVMDKNGHWRFNIEPTDTSVFHVVWTDNRDVRPPWDHDWTKYTPPVSDQPSEYITDSSTWPYCSEGRNRPGMRNQNIYTSRITQGVEVGAPTNNKPLNLDVPRAFSIYVKNTTEYIRSFRLTIAGQPPDGQASFLQFDFRDEIDVTIAPYSTIARPVFIESSDLKASVRIDIEEIDEPGGVLIPEGITSFILINSDPSNPEATGDIQDKEEHKVSIGAPDIIYWSPHVRNQDVYNPHVRNWDVINPDIVSPHVRNLDIVNPSVLDPGILDLTNPHVRNPHVRNADIINPHVRNPHVRNFNPEEVSIVDVEWLVKNEGNTTSSYTFKTIAKESPPEGIYLQLIVYKEHFTPGVDGSSCDLKQEVHHEVLANILNPHVRNPHVRNLNILDPEILNPAIENATFSIPPGEEVHVILRVVDTGPPVQVMRGLSSSTIQAIVAARSRQFDSFIDTLGCSATSQGADSEDAEQGIEEPEAAATILVIGTESPLPEGTIDEYYSKELTALGGIEPYEWWVDRTKLPPGLDINENTGEIFGTPVRKEDLTYPVTYTFTIQVTDSTLPENQSDSQIYSLTIKEPYIPPPPLAITTPSLPPGALNTSYNAGLAASGGVPAYHWSVVSGSLPNGLTLHDSGLISGIPRRDDTLTYPFTYSFTVQVTDSDVIAPQTVTQDFSIQITEDTFTISGTVMFSGSPLPGVVILGLPNAPITDANGFYTDTVAKGWSGTAEPSKAGYYFDPASEDYTNVEQNITMNYTAHLLTYTISGTVTYSGAPLPGVELNGLPGNPTTDNSGYYEALVEHGTSWTATPSLNGYTFDPPSRSYDSVTYNRVNQDYVASIEEGVDDSFEENDERGSASVIPLGTTPYLRLLDDDWYVVNIAGGEHLKVTLQGTFPEDIDIEIYDDSETQLAAGISPEEKETVYIFDGVAGDYYIHIPYWSEGLQNEYSLTIETVETGVGVFHGRVTDEATGEGINVRIAVSNLYSQHLWHTFTDNEGYYKIGVTAGDPYKLWFDTRPMGDYYPGSNYISEWYDNKPTFSRAESIMAGDNIWGPSVDAQLAAGGAVSGTITDPVGFGIEGASVVVFGPDGNSGSYAYTDENGNYTVERIPTGNYKLRIRPPSSGPYVLQWYGGKNSYEEALTVPVQAGETSQGMDVVLPDEGYIEGRVTGPNGTGLENVRVDVYDISHQILISRSWTDENGDYIVDRIPTGDFKIHFSPRDPDANHVPEWYVDKRDFDEASPVSTQAGETTFGVDVQLADGGTISGRVTDPGGEGLYHVLAYVFDLEGHAVRYAYTDVNGNYAVKRVIPGNLRVRFRPGVGTYGVEWYSDKSSYSDADSIVVQPNQTTSDINAQLAEGGFISGTVTNSSGVGIEGILVFVYDDSQQFMVSYSVTDSDGNYTVPRLPTDRVKVFFNADYTNYLSEWYRDRDSFDSARLVSTAAGQTTSGIDAVLEDKPPLSIATTSLPDGPAGEPYTTTLEATGGTEFYHWSLAIGSALPEGLTLDSNGIIRGTPTTAGNYSFIVEVIDSGSPQQSDTQSFDLTITSYTGTGLIISGTVAIGGVIPLEGVVMTGLPGDPSTNADGFYTVSVDYEWTGTVTPFLAGFTFNPASQSYVSLTSDQVDQNYTAISPNYTISGRVTVDGSPLPGVEISISDGDPVTTDGNGYYAATVDHGWSGTITPTLDGYTFDPPSREYDSVNYSLENQDYTTFMDQEFDDSFEDNDDIGTALPISLGTTHNLRLLDNDCFIVNVSGGPDLKIAINGILPRDMDIEIYDDSGNQLVGGISGSRAETVYLADVTPGDYFIVVPYWSSQGLQNAYSLTVETDDFGLGEINGVVVENPLDPGIVVRVDIYDQNNPKRWHTFSRDDGSYSISLPPGDYKLFFDSRPWDYFPYHYQGLNYVNEWYDNNPTSSLAAVLSIQADQTLSDINAILIPGGTITGRITDTEGSGLEGILVRDWSADGRTLSYAWTDSNGYYALERLPRGNFKVRIRPPWGTYAVEWYNDESSFEEGDTVRVEFGITTSDVDVVLEEGGFIEGRVTDISGIGIENVAVEVYDKTRSIFYSRGWTDENGYYSAPHMPTADVKVFFDVGSTSENYVYEWYADKPNYSEATLVSVQAGGTTFDIDAVLEVGGYAEGRVIDPNGEGLYRIQLNVFDLEGHGLRSVNTNENGDYTINRVRPGDIKARFRPNTGTYAVEWYNDKSSYAEADLFSVQSNQTTPDINAQLVEGGYISGRVTNTLDEGIEGVLVIARDDTQNFTIAYSVTDENGDYTVPRMPSGNVKVFFNAYYTGYVSEWYNGQDSFETAELIPTEAGNTTADIDAVLDKTPPLIVTTESLPDGELGVEYSATLDVTGGNEFYYWHLSSGSLPNGLTLDSNGHISGVPTAEGTYTFYVLVFDSPPYPNPNITNPNILNPKEFSITINPYAGPDIIISGAVSDGVSPLQGVVMEGLPGNPTTNMHGEYIATVPSGWTGTVTPFLSDYAFAPYSRDYTDVTANQMGQDYTATPPYTISGTVTLDGSPLQGALMDGLPGNPITNEQGEYAGIVHEEWSGTVSPSLVGFTFTPESITHTDVNSDIPNQDYTATFEGGADDSYEENDDRTNAREISLGTHANLVYLDEDWYKVYIPVESAGKDLKVHMKGIAYPNPNTGRDLDFGIFDSSGKLLGYVLSSSDDETLYITDLTEGWYTIGLNYFSQEGAVYFLAVEVGDNFGIGYVSGRVTDEQGQGIENIYVELYGEPFNWENNRPLITTDSDGYYTVGFVPGDYTVRFNSVSLESYYPDLVTDRNYIGEYYNNWPTGAGATVLSVVAGTTIEGINAELVEGGIVSGRVTDPGGNGEENVFVSVYDSDTTRVSYVYTDENGNYSVDRIPTGNYKVRFRPTYENYATEWYENKGSFEEAHPIPVQAGSTTSSINVQLEESGSLEGRVTNSVGDPLQNVRAYVYGLEGIYIVVGMTDENGYYRIDRRLPPGEVAVFFNASYTGENYVSEYYADKFVLEEATPVSIQAGQTTFGIDAQLADGGTITGRVTDSSGNGLSDILVVCADLDSELWYNTSTNEDGYYTLDHILPDDYRVRFRASSGDHATEWYNDKNSFANGDIISVSANQTISDVNAELADNGGYITGRVTDAFGAGIERVRVFARDNTKNASISVVFTDADGNYTLPRLPTCEARVYFDADYFRLNYDSEWYNDKALPEEADFVQVILGETTPGVNTVLAERPALAVATSSLPSGELAAPYSVSLEATGGREFYHWSLYSGMLPNGLTLESNGVINGVPTAIGTYSFTVRVSDSGNPQQFSLKNLNIAIDPYAGTDLLISGTVTLYGAPLSGVEMRGLSGNPISNAHGEYVAPVPPGWSGTVIPNKTGYYFDPQSMSYSSVNSNYLDQNYDGYVLTLNITTPWLLNGTENSPYSQTLEADEGIEPYTWSLAEGSLPYGLTLDSSGLISGTPTAPDTYEFTIRVTDSSTPPQYVEKEFTVTIHDQGIISEAPILYWKLNEGGGDTAQDSSGKEVHGTLNENAVYTNDAVEGWAVEMSGQGWIEKSSEGNFYFADEATMMAYVKIDDFNQEHRFIWKLQYNHPVLDYPYALEIHLEISGQNLTLLSRNALQEGEASPDPIFHIVNLSQPESGFNLGFYNQIAVSIKDDAYKIFINGDEVLSEPGAVFEVHDNPQLFWVGGASWSDTSLGGKIDEVAVFNRALASEEVDEHYQTGPMFLISGAITLNGSPLQGVWMEGLPGDPITNENGEYIVPVLPGWSGTASPMRDGYYFIPVSQSYEDVMSDQAGQDYTAYEWGSLRITTDWLPDGTIDSPYNFTIEAADGVGQYTWSIVGGFLPDGLALNPNNGEIEGTPIGAGDFSFTVQVIDENTPQQAARQDLSLSISPAHQGFWTTTYPFGGNMHPQGLAIDPADSEVIFATAENRGIFKSSDAGSNWTNITDDPDWPFWESDYGMFRIHLSSGNYYTSSGRGIYRSTDRGENWETIYDRENWDISTFTVDPASTNIIYVGTWEGEMFKTIDGGANWSACNSGLPSESIRTITIDPNASSTVYAGTFNSGVYKSTNSGDNWFSTNNNIDFQRVEDIVIDPNNSLNVYIASWYESDQGLFRSTDGGGSWEKLLGANVQGDIGSDFIAIDSSGPYIFYFASDQSVFKSSDGGNNWTEYSVSSAIIDSIVIDPTNSQILYAATRGEGVYKSEDGGINWTLINNGIRALSFPDVGHSIEFDESNPNIIYAGSLGGGYRSLDGGSSWEKMDFPQGSMTAVLTHPDTDGTVYAVFNSFWKSTSNGSSGSWVDPVVPHFCCVPRMDLGIASDNPDILYFTVKHSDDPQSGVYRSDDGGVTWTLKNNGLTHTDVRAIAVHPTDHQVVFAGTEWEWPLDPSKDYGLYKTIDGGENWNYISCGLPSDMYIHYILIYPGDPDIMFLAGGGEEFCGLFKSEDGGECWEQVSNNCAHSIAIASDNPDLLYIGHWEGFYVSLNGGRSWMEFNDGLPRNPQVNSIHLDPSDPFHVFIGTEAGVYEATFSFDFMITTEWLPMGIINEAYNAILEAYEGTPPISWEIVSGSLPDGLTLDQNSGEISGIPTMTGSFEFTVKATDDTGQSYSRQMNIHVSRKYVLNVTTNPAEGGSVSKNPDEPEYLEGDMVDVSLVTINPGYTFTGWSGDASGLASHLHVQMTRDKNITANFGLTVDLPDYYVDYYNVPTQADAGEIVGGSISVRVGNNGGNDTCPEEINVGVYLSPDPQITPSDILLWKGRASITALNSGETTDVAFDPDMMIPTTITAGDYFIGVLIDESNVAAERDENNNFASDWISITSAAEFGRLELLGGWPYGSLYGHTVDEARNLSIIGHGGTLQVLDVSNPSNPTLMGELSLAPASVLTMKISGNNVFVANSGGGLKVVDISNPYNPYLIGSCDAIHSARSLDISGDYAFVTDYHQGLRIIDISDPAAPFQTAFLPLHGRTRLIEVQGDFVYITRHRALNEPEGELGIRIVDVSNPYNPVERALIQPETGFGEPCIDATGQFLFVQSGRYLRVYDVSNPDAPFEANVYEGDASVSIATIVGNHAYVAFGRRLDVLDISDINNITAVSSYWFEDPVNLMYPAVAGDLCFINSWYESLRIVDFSDFNSPQEVGSYDIVGLLDFVEVSDDHAYVVNSRYGRRDGLKILDLSNLSDITETATTVTPYYLYGVKVSEGHAFLPAWDNGLRSIAISDPSNPLEVGAYEDLHRARDIVISGKYAYIADGWDGLRVFDISSPSNPELVSTLRTDGYVYQVAVSGNYAYLAANWGGLRIVNISDPMNPWEVGSYEFDSRAFYVSAAGDYAYVHDRYQTLRIIDVSNPANPFEVSQFGLYYAWGDIAISGNLIFVPDWVWGVRVIDVSNPSNPTEIEVCDEVSTVEEVIIRENTIYVVNRDAGIYVYEFRVPDPEQTISGNVVLDGGSPLQGVLLEGLPEETTTNEFGEYTATVSTGWTGTVMPTLAGYFFIPSQRMYDTVTSNNLDQNYTGYVGDPLIITTTWLPDGILTIGYNETIDATGGTPVYTWGIVSGSLPGGLNLNSSSGMISGTPTEAGNFVFQVQVTDLSTPPQSFTQEYNININAYAGPGHIISGTVTSDGLPLDGVVMTGLPEAPTTNTSGFYMAVVDDGWSGTVFPSKEGYAFDPSSRNYLTVVSNQMGQDYEAGSITEEWVARYNGPAANSYDEAMAVTADSSGNIYVTGGSSGSGTFGDYATIKYDSTGDQVWVAKYSDPAEYDDIPVDIVVDSSGNVYVTGFVGYRQAIDYATIKYDSNGDQVWMAKYDGPGDNFYDRAVAIAVDSVGNVFVTGYSFDTSVGNYDYVTVKYDSDGNQVWVARYDGPISGDDRPFGIAVDSSGNAYVTGRSYGDGTNYDYATIKYDSNGDQDWVARFDGPTSSRDVPSSIAVDSSGNAYVTGQSYRSDTRDDYATIKYNSSDGSQEWIAWYHNSSSDNAYDYAHTLSLDSAGNVYVTGYSRVYTVEGSHYDYATVKYNSAGVEQWAATYDGPVSGDDRAYAVDTDSGGNVYVTGWSLSSNMYDEYATVKYSSTGSELWVRRYDGSANGDDQATGIVVDSSGNIVVTGLSHGSSTYYDYATIKYDSSGNPLWNTEGDGAVRYNGSTNEENMYWAYGGIMDMDSSNNVYISGYSFGNGTAFDYTTVKFDSDGDQAWVARYNGPGNYNDFARDMAVDSSGNAYVTGYTYIDGMNRDYATVKYNSAGAEEWAKTYDGPENGIDYAYGIAVDTSGNVYVTGYSEGTGTGTDCVTIKYNSAGALQWVARYDGPENRNDSGWAITVDTAGNVYVTGRTYTGSAGRYDYLTIKYNSAGVEEWVSTYDGSGNQNDYPYFIALDSSNNVYVCGYSYGNGSYDYATVKYNSTGYFQWAARYDGPGNGSDYPHHLAVDSADNVYVTGRSPGNGTYADIATVKYDSGGNELWVRRYQGESPGSYNYGSGIAFDSSGNVYVAGRTGGTDRHYDGDCITMKYDSDGNPLWIRKYNGPGDGVDGGHSISVTPAGDVYVAGLSVGIGTGTDFFVIKYRQ